MEIISFLNKILYHQQGLDQLTLLEIVEIEKADYRSGSYPNHEFYKIKGKEDSKLYMKQLEEDEEDFDHNLVWQTSGGYGCEDCYYGFLLFPIGDDKYIHCSYSC